MLLQSCAKPISIKFNFMQLWSDGWFRMHTFVKHNSLKLLINTSWCGMPALVIQAFYTNQASIKFTIYLQELYVVLFILIKFYYTPYWKIKILGFFYYFLGQTAQPHLFVDFHVSFWECLLYLLCFLQSPPRKLVRLPFIWFVSLE